MKKKNQFPTKTSRFKYKAVEISTADDGSFSTWSLQKNFLGLFWREIKVGNQIDIINRCKNLNQITGSHNFSYNLTTVEKVTEPELED